MGQLRPAELSADFGHFVMHPPDFEPSSGDRDLPTLLSQGVERDVSALDAKHEWLVVVIC